MMNELIIEKDKEIDSLRSQVRILQNMAFSSTYHAPRTATEGVVDEEVGPKAISSPFDNRSFEEYEVIPIQTATFLVELKVYTFQGKPFVLSNNLNQCLPYRTTISKEVAFLSHWQEFKEWSTVKIANRVKGVMVDMNLINWIQNIKNSTQLIKRITHLIPTQDISMDMDLSMISPVKRGYDISMESGYSMKATPVVNGKKRRLR
jgi:hypothetical protein